MEFLIDGLAVDPNVGDGAGAIEDDHAFTALRTFSTKAR